MVCGVLSPNFKLGEWGFIWTVCWIFLGLWSTLPQFQIRRVWFYVYTVFFKVDFRNFICDEKEKEKTCIKLPMTSPLMNGMPWTGFWFLSLVSGYLLFFFLSVFNLEKSKRWKIKFLWSLNKFNKSFNSLTYLLLYLSILAMNEFFPHLLHEVSHSWF